jgi:acyl carrier protein
MDRRETERRVIRILAEQLGYEEAELSRETRLDALDADSIDLVEVVMMLEGAFGIERRKSSPPHGVIQTLGDLIDWVMEDDEGGDSGVVSKRWPRPSPPGGERASLD